MGLTVGNLPPRSLGGDESALVGADDSLRAVACVQLGEHVRDVGLDRFETDDQVRGDLGVRQPSRYEAQHLGLAFGEPSGIEAARRGRGGRVARREFADGGRKEQRVTGGEQPDGADDLIGSCALEQKPGGSSAQGVEDVVVVFEGGEDEDPWWVVEAGEEASCGLDAVDDPPRIHVLTTFENDDYVFEALRAGASGFLLKRARPDELIRAIRLLAAGDSLLFPAAIRELAARHSPAEPSACGLDAAGLTEREAEVLRLVAQGLSNAEIAAHLIVSLETVKTHVAHVLTKLDARDRTQAVIRAYQTGFITPP